MRRTHRRRRRAVLGCHGRHVRLRRQQLGKRSQPGRCSCGRAPGQLRRRNGEANGARPPAVAIIRQLLLLLLLLLSRMATGTTAAGRRHRWVARHARRLSRDPRAAAARVRRLVESVAPGIARRPVAPASASATVTTAADKAANGRSAVAAAATQQESH